MSERVLSPEGLNQFFDELEGGTEVLSVIPSQHSRRCEEGMPLAAARDALLRLRLSALELRYLAMGRVWRDTILPTLDGFRLVHQPA